MLGVSTKHQHALIRSQFLEEDAFSSGELRTNYSTSLRTDADKAKKMLKETLIKRDGRETWYLGIITIL